MFVRFLLSALLAYRYPVLFVFVFLAALAVPLPMNTFLLSSGAFAALGYFDIGTLFVVAFVANSLGDIGGYWLARAYGPRALHFLRIEHSPYLVRLETYARSHSRTSVFVTRFLGALNPAMNVLAGITEIPLRTFLVFGALGNMLSIGAVMGVGYYAGDYWPEVSRYVLTGKSLLVVIIVAAILFIAFHVQKRRTKKREQG